MKRRTRADAPDREEGAAKQRKVSTAGVAKAAKPAKKAAAERNYHSEYYLMKNEPDNFSIDDLVQADNQTCEWEGVRNYQARNILRAMKTGQQAFYYHSNCKVPGVVGIVEIVREAYPDHTAWDKKSKYYDDGKSTPDNPRWFMVDIKLVRKLDNIIRLEDIKQHREQNKDGALKDMPLLAPGSRLSVQNVSKAQWDTILALEAS